MKEILKKPLYTGSPIIVNEKLYNMMKDWKPGPDGINTIIGTYKGIPVYKDDIKKE